MRPLSIQQSKIAMKLARTRLLLLLVMLTIMLFPTTQPAHAQSCLDDATLVNTKIEPTSETVTPGTSIVVEWTLRNSGDCTWGRTYRLNFVEGDRMDGPRTIRQRSTVRPDQELTLRVELTAPDDFDQYSGTWQLRNGDGKSFGPPLTVNVQVGEQTTQGLGQSPTEVILPEVLVFGGMGEGNDPNVLYQCLQNGQLPTSPTLVVGDDALIYRYFSLFLCSLPEGAEVTVEITNPLGETFQKSFVEDAPVVGDDENGNVIEGSVLEVTLAIPEQAPTGDWAIRVTGGALIEGFSAETSIYIDDPSTDYYVMGYPLLDNWPNAPIDPFAAAGGCNYAYAPGQEMFVSGIMLPPNASVVLGVYQDRFGHGYLMGQLAAQTDADGNFTVEHQAFTEPGTYNIVLLDEINAKGFDPSGTQYDPDTGGTQSSTTCYTIKQEVAAGSAEAIPLRLAFAQGMPGLSEILVYDLDEGIAYYPTYTAGKCDSSEPAWWPDGQWILYQSNCVSTFTDQWVDVVLGGDYDLYASMIDPTETLPEEEKLIRLTQTPNMNETEPDANLDGLIVYRSTPVGYALDQRGELRILNVNDGSDITLNIYGRAPTWSPDGERIAFMSDAEGTWQIYAYDLTDDSLWLVSENCATQCRLPAWSPDGKQIIYHQSISMEDFTPDSLWIASASSTNKPRRYLTGAYGRPAWSSSKWIALQGPGGIYRATPDRAIPGRNPNLELYLYSDGKYGEYWSPVWSR